MRWTSIGLVLLSILFAIPTGQGAQPQAAARLNVVFIMSDQHNARALGCYGNREIRTPNLDRLAKQGTLFTRTICQTGQCVPSRYSIWTGRYARSHGTYSNGNMQNPQELTVAKLFKQAGYATATFGKHHMVMNEATANHGFDTVEVPSAGWKYNEETVLPYDQAHPGRAKVGQSSLPNEEHDCGLIAAKTIEYVRQNKDRPFVVWCSFHGPHTPICPSLPWARWYDPARLSLPPSLHQVDREMPGAEAFLSKSGTYDSEDLYRKTLAYYYGYVSQIDHNIGLVLDELDRQGLAGRTIVVYTADHGEMMAEHGAWTKGSTGHEATIRVPLILRLAGVVPAGKRVDDLACSIDLLPTLLDAAGLETPARVQGKSLLPLVQGKAGPWRKYAFSELGGSVDNQVVAVTSTTWKYVRFKQGGQVVYEQFFDLVKDPWEMQNLARDTATQGAKGELVKALADWEATTETTNPVTRAAPKAKTDRPRKKAPGAVRNRAAVADR